MLGTAACFSWDENTGKVSREDIAGVWELAAEATKTGNRFYLKSDTVSKRIYNRNHAITGLVGYKNVNLETTEYTEYLIKTSDCKNGYGIIYELDFNDKLIGKHDIALDGSSVIAKITSTLCANM